MAVYSISHFKLNAASATCKSSTSLNALQIYTRIVTFSQLLEFFFPRNITHTKCINFKIIVSIDKGSFSHAV